MAIITTNEGIKETIPTTTMCAVRAQLRRLRFELAKPIMDIASDDMLVDLSQVYGYTRSAVENLCLLLDVDIAEERKR